MKLTKIPANGQITVPVEIRRQFGLKSGDKLLFLQKQNGEIVISDASSAAIRKGKHPDCRFAPSVPGFGCSSSG